MHAACTHDIFDGCTSESLLCDVERLLDRHVDVVESDPLVVLVRVGAHDAGVRLLDGPPLVDNVAADLVVGHVPVLLRAGTLAEHRDVRNL